MQERIRFLGCGLAVLACMLIAGCSWQYLRPDSVLPATRQAAAGASDDAHTDLTASPQRGPRSVADEVPATVTPEARQLWEVLAEDLRFHDQNRPEVQRQIRWYDQHRSLLTEASERATLYLHFVLAETRERGMPADLALLPIVESGYRPGAISRHGAAGLWQFMGGTGRKFGLERNAWSDERLDVVASTEAALDYLGTLAKRFDGDWLLAIAAYNAGWGNVERALARNRRAGRSLDVWSLPLSGETRLLLARMVALSEIYRAPSAHRLTLPPAPDTPYFAPLILQRPTDLRMLIRQAQIDENEFRRLNPGLVGWHSGPAPARRVLVPVATLERALTVAAALPAATPASAPGRSRLAATRTGSLAEVADGDTYTVVQGDSLWLIARRFGTRTEALARLNHLAPGAVLALGQRLVVRDRSAPESAASPSERPGVERGKLVRYAVREGDSLWTISVKFSVTVDQLLAWNDLAAVPILQPGQELILYMQA